VKPQPSDRNVNVEELIYFVWNHVPGLHADFRVGGDIDLLQRFLAAGIPIMIEEGMLLDTSSWPNDDRWAGHYLLLTGYDADNKTFIGQDSFYGADQQVSFGDLDANWKVFNRVYIFVYPPEIEGMINGLLGPHEDYVYNRQYALEIAKTEIQNDPEDAFAWFNLGSNLVYFERYSEAAEVYDTVRQLGVPQRMWRYQFSPFLAYFHAERTDDLLALTEYALKITEISEEALLWRGWGRVRSGDVASAIADFRAALSVNPNYQDALYALEYLGASPQE
jgi:tetratricopeptide (TPR) repeat protein